MEKIGHAQLCTELIARHRILLDLIGTRPFHYVDIPIHGNIGDVLILHGTLAFFKNAGLTPRLMSPYFSFDLDWVGKDDAIVFHGGGNFGDLYPYYHALRERVARARPGNRIIILPQSVHFSSPEKAAASARLFRSHPDLHLCLRDTVSFEVARQFTDKVYLLPDMAHQLYPLVSPFATPARGTLVICRSDDERIAQSTLKDVVATLQTDWPEFVGTREYTIARFRRVIDAMARRRMGRLANRIISPLWVRYSHGLMMDAARMFGCHEQVISDRLHGHILACVMGIRNIVLDNNYGKNSRYAQTWTARSELVTVQVQPIKQRVAP